MNDSRKHGLEIHREKYKMKMQANHDFRKTTYPYQPLR